MADKFTQQTTTNVILTAHNELRTALSQGNIIPRLSESAIYAIVNADNTKTLLVYNTDTEQVEVWVGTNRLILG